MTEELIAKLKAARTDEERKAILDKEAGKLSDEDLDSIAGGCGGCSAVCTQVNSTTICPPHYGCLDEFVGPE